MKCPLCKQHVPLEEEPHIYKRDLTRERRKMVKSLRAAGYSMRQIQRTIGWKSVRSVQLALEQK